MESQTKTTTRLDKIKEYLKYASSFLFKSDDEIEGGYTNCEDIPDPNIENYPEEADFFNQANEITSQIARKTRNNINKTSRENIEEDEKVNEQAKENRKQIKMNENKKVNENIR